MALKGIGYPLTKHPQGYFHSAATELSQVKSDMAAIILTEPGERVFENYFGTPLSKLHLNAPAELVAAEARMMIAVSLKKWEKRVQVEDIVVNLVHTDDKKLVLNIRVLFINPNDINNLQDLVVYKYLGEVEKAPF